MKRTRPGARSEPRSGNPKKAIRENPGRRGGYRPNPRRQAMFIAIAVVGIGIGYGAGYLFQDDSAEPPVPAPAEARVRTAPTVGPRAPEPRPVLPEGTPAARDETVRPYEEALPGNVVVNGGAATEPAPPAPPPPRAEPPAAGPAGAPAPTPASPPPAEKTAAPEVAAVTSTRRADDPGLPAWKRYAVAVTEAGGRPRIAMVMDDLGIDKLRTARVLKLPGPLTVSFLTYASGLDTQTRAARNAGHELLMHIPMEPGSVDVDPGPNVLLTGLPRNELLASLRWNLEQFGGYVGVNNHMGSRFTADLAGMRIVMEELRKRELLFLDSVTAGDSVGRRAAREMGVPFAVRNVFVDNVDEVDAILKQLAEVETLARHKGAAVAIGHPREATLTALDRWLPEVKARGFQLVPISAIVQQ